jgi:ATP-binding cassette subfamily B protein
MKVSNFDYCRLLARYLWPQRAKVLWLAVALLGSIALQLVGPQLFRAFIDTALEGGALSVLARIAGLYLAIGVVNQLSSAVATYLGADVGWTSTNTMREELSSHCLGLDMTFHNERTPGELIERIDGDVTNLSNFLSQFLIQILGSVLLTVGVLILLFLENVWVGAALTAFTVVAVLCLVRARHMAVPAFIAQREAASQFFGFAEEKMAALDDIRGNGGGGYAMDRFFRTNHTFFHTSRKAWMLRSLLFYILMLMFAVADVVAIGMGVYLHQAGAITIGTVFLFFTYTEMLRNPISRITMQLQDLQNAGASMSRIHDLFSVQSALSRVGHEMLERGPLDVQFDNVIFGYGNGEPVLHGVDFTIAPGRVLGLLGRTGSGKTTITRLIFRLYDTREGTVRLGGQDVRALELEDLREHVGLVTQDVQLFDASVRNNITFFNTEVSDDRLLEVIGELGLAEWIERLPEGLDTLIGSGGKGLSAGEAQLLAFIRVFLKDPGLVILDEPSSRLDPGTERLLQVAWGRLLHDRTGIIIAHRLATLRETDEILLLDDGRIIERGDREALARDPTSRFAALLRAAQGTEDLLS